jgi:signal transduction histidine kinase
MKCSRCQHENRATAKFCEECATPLQAVSPDGPPAPSYAELTSALTEAHAHVSEALEQQTATAEILRVISSSPTDVQPVFDAIAQNARRLCRGDFSVVVRYDGELLHRGSEAHATAEGSQVLRRILALRPSRAFAVARAVLERAVVHLPDVQADPEMDQPVAAALRNRSAVAVPMLRDGQPLGGISVGRFEALPFTVEQIAVLQAFADQAVIAIENVRLFKELETSNHDLTQALEQQTATSEILRVISNSPTDLQSVLEAVAENAARVCGADDVIIHRIDGEVLRAVAHHGAVPLFPPIGSSEGLPIHGSITGRAVLERRVIHVHDVAGLSEAEFPVARSNQQLTGQRTTLAAPLLRESVPIGTILIRRREVCPFTDKQIEMLKTFADQAVIALENVRLFKELEARNAELTESLEQQTATSEILRVISSSPTDVQPVFDMMVRSAARLCDASFCVAYRFDGELIHPTAHHNMTPEALDLLQRMWPAPPSRDTVTARSMLERSIVHVSDVEEEGVSGASIAFGRVLGGYRTMLAVPMFRDGVPIGAISLARRERRPFPEKQIALLQTFADQAVIAIENVRLFKELETRTAELTRSVGEFRALGEVGQAISSTLDLQTVLGTIVARATQLAGVEAGVIYEYDEQQEVFEPRATHHLEEEIVHTLVTAPVRKGEGATGRLAEVREPIQWPDIRTTTLQGKVRDVLLRVGYRGLLAVPLLREDHLIGGLTVIRKAPGEFGPEIVQLLTTFATQSALAIQNARLFREIEEKSRELEALSRNMEQLYRLSTAMQEPLSLKEQLGRVLETATRIGLLDRIYVWAVSPEGDKLVNLAGAGFAEDESKQFEGFAIPLVEAGAMYRSLREGRPLLFDDENPLSRDLYLKPQYLLKGLRTSRFLIIPMIARGEPVGVFAGDNKPSGRPIARETVELLQTFASHAAVAIANAHLFRTIEEKSRELEVASRHKSEFLANMSHELRTPLNAIIGFSEVLAEGMFGDVNEKQTEYLNDILESGRHLLSLINDILDLSKIEAGRMELEATDFDLPGAIENALILVRERATRRGISLGRTIDERLGVTRADERKVKQVLLNLLSNALKFTPEGGRIDVRATICDDSAEIAVTDTGVGIAPEDQEAVFQEFRQVGTAAKKVEGTGLGLALSRKFIELHGGKIWVKSQVGEGSTFTFTLPLRRGE